MSFKYYNIKAKYIRILKIFTILLLFTGLSTCSKTLEGTKKDYTAADKEETNALLLLIEKINNKNPDSFDSRFIIEGHSGKQNFKTSGKVQFNHTPRKMRVIFHDAVFKTPIVELIQDNDILKFYYPIDKRIIIDNINKLNIKFYLNYDLNFNFSFIYDILTHRIPVIDNYSVKKGLQGEERQPGKDGLIILENDSFYETLSFSNEIPDKILCLNKKTRERIEVYLNDPSYIEGILSYRNIRLVSPESNVKINIYFSSKRINVPVDQKKITNIKLPKDVKVLYKN
ncbi:MAG: hypothetical protein JW864_12690 [Spirochaetes bacterium]|nr:hypothetical protein [Spirochaetota bacterium]